MVPEACWDQIKRFQLYPENIVENIDRIRKEAGLPYLASDRNVLNLPGLGKSLTFRTIGLTYDGRRILEFKHDATRANSPIIEKMGRITIIESKDISAYLKQLEDMGEEISEYETIYGYSIGETEPRLPIFEYPEYDFEVSDKLTNLEIDN